MHHVGKPKARNLARYLQVEYMGVRGFCEIDRHGNIAVSSYETDGAGQIPCAHIAVQEQPTQQLPSFINRKESPVITCKGVLPIDMMSIEMLLNRPLKLPVLY
jgi:hypothetical protein